MGLVCWAGHAEAGAPGTTRHPRGQTILTVPVPTGQPGSARQRNASTRNVYVRTWLHPYFVTRGVTITQNSIAFLAI